jgi:hypothetical protein
VHGCSPSAFGCRRLWNKWQDIRQGRVPPLTMHNLLTWVGEVKKFGPPRCADGAKVGSLISDHKMSWAARAAQNSRGEVYVNYPRRQQHLVAAHRQHHATRVTMQRSRRGWNTLRRPQVIHTPLPWLRLDAPPRGGRRFIRYIKCACFSLEK